MATRVGLKAAVAVAAVGFGIVFGGATRAQADCRDQCYGTERRCCSGGRCAYTQACIGIQAVQPGSFMPNPAYWQCKQGVDTAKQDCAFEERDCVRQCELAASGG